MGYTRASMGAGLAIGLLGRDRDRERVLGLLAAARAGGGHALVVVGEPGIGKSALLEAAAAAAEPDVLVLRAGGEEAEQQLAFSALQRLLAPLADRVAALPPAQSRAVSVALSLGADDGDVDRFAVYAGTLALLCAAAEREPVLCLIDDVQWVDEASCEAIGFVARRLDADALVLLAAAREASSLRALGSGFEELPLAGLDPASGRALLVAAWPDLAPHVVDALYAATQGNPLALLELPAALGERQRRGVESLDDLLPGTAELERAFGRRLADLPAPARAALVVAAVLPSGDLALLQRACAAVGADARELEHAEHAGVVELAHGRVTFRHNLLRAIAYHQGPPGARRAAHAAVAAVVGEDERAWQLAAACVLPDESVAAELEAAAGRAGSRAGHASAGRALERAAELTPDPAKRGARLVAAADAARLAGRPAWALALLDGASADARGDGERGAVARLRGRIAARTGDARTARDLFVGEAARVEEHAPAQAAELLAEAVLPCLRAGEPAGAVALARRAAALAPDAGDGLVPVVLATALAFAGELTEARALLERVDTRGAAASLQLRAYLGSALRLVGAYERSRALLGPLLDELRDASAIGLLPYTLTRLANLDIETGRFAEAASGLSEAVELAGETGGAADRGLALGGLAWLDAVLGRDEACRSRAAAALGVARELGEGSRLDYAASALALLDLARGDVAAAATQLERVRDAIDEQGWHDAAVLPHHLPDLAESYVRAGRGADARAVIARFAVEAERIGRPSALAAAARCRGLVVEDSAVDEVFAEALAAHALTETPFELARTRLCYGERLRRARRRVEAREQLASALETFERLGAEPWSERARRELRATGARARRRSAETRDDLTPHELQIALVIAEGVTNREAAARLFLSPKTVESHLSNVYRKLGVRTRTELARRLAAGDVPLAPV